MKELQLGVLQLHEHGRHSVFRQRLAAEEKDEDMKKISIPFGSAWRKVLLKDCRKAPQRNTHKWCADFGAHHVAVDASRLFQVRYSDGNMVKPSHPNRLCKKKRATFHPISGTLMAS